MIDKYSEISGREFASKLKKYVSSVKLDFKIVKEYLPLYPDKVYRNIRSRINGKTDIKK